MRGRQPNEVGLIEAARRVFPGGVLGRHKLRADVQMVPVSGHGAHVVDASGREYIDYTCAGGSVLLGYDHPAVKAAIVAQAGKAANFLSMLNEPAIRYAADLQATMPIGGLVRFCSSGSEGTFYAIRLARAFTGRDKVLKFEGAYHGHHDYAMWSYNAVGEKVGEARANTAGIARQAAASMIVASYGDREALKAMLSRHAGDIACILVEPVQRMMAPPAGFLEAVRALADEHGIVLVWDETVTGFRLALGGAQERFGVVPDLAVYGKSLGGGLPLAAVMGKPEIMGLAAPEAWTGDPRGVFFSGTLYGNPLACAAGGAFLSAIKAPGHFAAFHANAEALKAGLRQRLARRGVDAHVVGEGPMWRLHFGDQGKIHDPRAKSDSVRQTSFDYGLIEEGILVRPGGGHYFSMAVTGQDIEATLAAADRVLARI
jgi:glutamate-1-semialdehyde 2,1-aminomutase